MKQGSTAGRVAAGRREAGALVVVSLVLACGVASGQPGVVSRQEALDAVFAGATVTGDCVYLTAQQAERIAELAREDVRTRIYARYVARRDGLVVGRAYVDTHVVRTKRESLLISIEPDGRVRRIDVTAFLEPPEYVPPERWKQQYYERPLGDDIAIHRAIRPIAGGTLTTRAVNAAVRRVLALDQVLEGSGPGRAGRGVQ